MKTEITCVYDRKTNPNFFSRISHGLAFYIKSGSDHILFDMGLIGRVLMKNLEMLDINPNIITKIVFSHGHTDHVRGLGKFLEYKSKGKKILVHAHSDFKEPKYAKRSNWINKGN